jgi:hypothetical protein
MARVAALLFVAGLGIVLWYAAWGVHGCDTSPCERRMDRDVRIYVAGWLALAVSLVLVVVGRVRRP